MTSAPTAGPLALIELAGLRPIMVPDLGRDALLLEEYGLALIDPGANERLDRIADWLVGQVLEQVTADAAS